jgi:hypothetical protein
LIPCADREPISRAVPREKGVFGGEFGAPDESGFGPKLPTLALQQVGSYQGYTGRANVIANAALDHS